MMNKKLIQKINSLKKQKQAIILVHNYQRKEIYEIADFIGDSLDLAKKASKSKAKIIIFCGVDFMAETAKILSPSSKVLLPAKSAACPMANMITVNKLKELKAKHPGAAVVSYVNTNADIKAESDACCTSMNAIRIVERLPQKKIIFIPDVHLGEWVKAHTEKDIIACKGFCYVHSKILEEQAKKAKQLHPGAKLVAHPESPMEVLKLADYVTGTGGMIKYARESESEEFIIATEEGMVNRLIKEVPNKKFYAIGGVCFNMKKITLEKAYDSLEKEQFEIKVDKEIAKKAKKALDRMIELS
ncbi:quinolinate synthase NadA [Candidatus Woesearchaeota archaeon]|nr:quinolinate synthase NadA [Candidatus Woesearchaeota archaeon]